MSEDEQGEGGGEPPYEEVCAARSSGAGPHGLLGDSGLHRALVAADRPRQLEPAARVQRARGKHRHAGLVARGVRRRRTLLAVAELEPYSSQGPTVDGRVKPDLVGHDSVSSATYGAFEGCPSGFAGNVGLLAGGRGSRGARQAGVPEVRPDQIKDLLMRSARDLGAPGLDNVYGAGELQLPKPPDVVAPTAKALVSTGRRGTMLRLLSTVSDDSGEVSVVEQIKLGRKTVATIERGGFVSASSSKTVATLWKVPTKAGGAYQHCVRGRIAPATRARRAAQSSSSDSRGRVAVRRRHPHWLERFLSVVSHGSDTTRRRPEGRRSKGGSNMNGSSRCSSPPRSPHSHWR